MSQLIVVIYTPPYCATAVLSELRRGEWHWVADLNYAAAVTLDEKGYVTIEMKNYPSTRATSIWAALWGSLLSATSSCRSIVYTHESPTGGNVDVQAHQARRPDAAWWKDEVRVSELFLSALGKLLKAGHSAIFMLLHTSDPSSALTELTNYGYHEIIHTSLRPEQDIVIGQLFGG